MKQPLLEVIELRKHFAQRRGLLGTLPLGGDTDTIPAIDGVSLSMYENETLGLVGESGCGKTTTGKAILKLISVDAGRITYQGTDITSYTQAQFRPPRRDIQMIFQDLDAALNPKMRIEEILREAVRVREPLADLVEVLQQVYDLLDLVNIKKNKLSNFPSELSGGEKRRIGIARVLAVRPKLIVADEPTSALDVSIQAQVINLLRDLQMQLGLSFLFISHDLQLVELVSHRVAVMYLGQIVEMGPARDIANAARHPYTSILWSSVVEKRSLEAQSKGSSNNWGVYDFERPSAGCRFAPRCPVYARLGQPGECIDPANPPKLKLIENSHVVACHFPLRG
ncbi:MAG: ABC transporter ATP-binding protein [Pseudomonadota bacterium]